MRHDPLGRLHWNEDAYYWNLAQHDRHFRLSESCGECKDRDHRCDAFLAGFCEDEGQSGLRSWKKASENRTLSQSTDTHVSSPAQVLGRNTARFGQIRAYAPSQIEWAQGLAKEGPKGGLALHEYTWNDFRREHLELLDPGERSERGSSRLCSHCEAIETSSSSSLMSTLVNTKPPLATSYVADLPAKGKTTI